MSPGIDAGSSTPGAEEMDLDGVQFTDENGNMIEGFGDAPDIGAYEYTFGCSLPLGHIDYCRDCGPCAEGEGDCDNDDECENGLTCVPDLQVPSTDICSMISVTCPGDSDQDMDVDGTDLADFIFESEGLGLDEFAVNYGKINCP
jgi:hypothetical protein